MGWPGGGGRLGVDKGGGQVRPVHGAAHEAEEKAPRRPRRRHPGRRRSEGSDGPEGAEDKSASRPPAPLVEADSVSERFFYSLFVRRLSEPLYLAVDGQQAFRGTASALWWGLGRWVTAAASCSCPGAGGALGHFCERAHAARRGGKKICPSLRKG